MTSRTMTSCVESGRWFRPFAPTPPARDVLTCRWTASGTGCHLLVPDGSMDICWLEGGGLWLCGPDTKSWTVDLGTAGVSVGIRFHPGAAAQSLRLDAVDLLDRRIPLDAVIGSRAARILSERIESADSDDERMQELECLVTSGSLAPISASRHNGDRAVRAAVEALSVSERRIDHVATQTDLSPRQLQRRFVRHVGYPPSQFARIARLQRFMHRSSIAPRWSLADLALSAGYAVQSHLSRECRTITGITPSQLRAGVDATSHAAPDVAANDADVRSVQDTTLHDQQHSPA